jgi:cytochrome c oxidase assembly protein subunit 15/protoheme IX farnesyltransferase
VLWFNLLVILWGALVRASRSGEGCGDHWPLCNGSVIPHAAAVETIIEFVHRVTSGPMAWVAVAIMAVWAWRSFRGELVARAAMWSFVLITIEGLLGAGLVLFRMTGTNASVGRVLYLSAHLVNTLLMLAALTITAWWASGHRRIEWSHGGPLTAALLAALAVAVTGAVTALSDTLFPAQSLSAGFAADFSAGSHWLVKVRALHPLIAVIGGIYLAVVGLRNRSAAVVSLVVLQICAGLLNFFLLAPVWMQIVHLLIADLLWIALVLMSAEALEAPVETREFEHAR